MLVTLRKCGQDHDKIQGRLAQQRNCENSLCWRCFWLHSTHTTTSNHSCSPQASVSWRGPSGPEPGILWKKVPPGSIITNCTVPELCSQKPCGDMAIQVLGGKSGGVEKSLWLQKRKDRRMASYPGTTCHWKAEPPPACVLRMETHNLLQPHALVSTMTTDQYNQLSRPWAGICVSDSQFRESKNQFYSTRR